MHAINTHIGKLYTAPPGLDHDTWLRADQIVETPTTSHGDGSTLRPYLGKLQ
jgi:hypothetical protein